MKTKLANKHEPCWREERRNQSLPENVGIEELADPHLVPRHAKVCAPHQDDAQQVWTNAFTPENLVASSEMKPEETGAHHHNKKQGG